MFNKYIEMIPQALTTWNEGSIIALVFLFLVLALGEFGVPVPFVLSGVLFYIGYQLVHGNIQVIPLLLVLISGRLFGSAIVYWLSHFLGNPLLNWLEKRFRAVPNRLEKFKGKLGIQASLAVTLGRLTPGLLVPTSLMSGAMRLRYDYFALGIVLSTIVWDGTFIALGIILGRGTQYLGLDGVSPWLILGSLAAVIALVWGVRRFLLRHKGRYLIRR